MTGNLPENGLNFWVKPSNNIETNKRPPEMIYLSPLGAYWNEYGIPSSNVKANFNAKFPCQKL